MQQQVTATLTEMKEYQESHKEAMMGLTKRFELELDQKDELMTGLRNQLKLSTQKIEELSKLIAVKHRNEIPWRVGPHARSVEEPPLTSAAAFYQNVLCQMGADGESSNQSREGGRSTSSAKFKSDEGLASGLHKPNTASSGHQGKQQHKIEMSSKRQMKSDLSGVSLRSVSKMKSTAAMDILQLKKVLVEQLKKEMRRPNMAGNAYNQGKVSKA